MSGDYDVLSVPIYRFQSENSEKITAADAIEWLIIYDLQPMYFLSAETEHTFKILNNLDNSNDDDDIWWINDDCKTLEVDEEKIFNAVMSGLEFKLLPKAKELLTSMVIPATKEFTDKFKAKLLNCDKIRADLDPYDANILIDPNRGTWDLWNYGEDEEKAGEITLAEGLTARNPADDINLSTSKIFSRLINHVVADRQRAGMM